MLTQILRDMDKFREKQTIDTGRQTGFVTESRQLRRHAVKIQTCRQNGWLRERERDRQTDRQTDRQRHRESDT